MSKLQLNRIESFKFVRFTAFALGLIGTGLIGLSSPVMSDPAGDLQREAIREEAERKAAYEAKLSAARAHAERSLANYKRPSSGDHPDTGFLLALFTTYDQGQVSAEIGSVVEWYLALAGEKSWKREGTVWILNQQRTSGLNQWVFLDLRNNPGDVRAKNTKVFLNDAYLLGKKFNHGQLYSLASQVVKPIWRR